MGKTFPHIRFVKTSDENFLQQNFFRGSYKTLPEFDFSVEWVYVYILQSISFFWCSIRNRIYHKKILRRRVMTYYNA